MSEKKISESEAIKAIETILKYIGEDPTREGLLETPKRIIRSYKELFSGYNQKAEDILNKKFFETNHYNDLIILKSIEFSSFCEHHMLPFKGVANIGYIPNGYVVGISKIARLVETHARKLQIQERMNVDISTDLEKFLNPKAVAVHISANHSCMSMRGVNKQSAVMETMHFVGEFLSNPRLKRDFLSRI
jgi:GTP cyclohydrolase I